MAYVRKAKRNNSDEAIGKRLADLRKKINNPEYLKTAVENLVDDMVKQFTGNWKESVWHKKK